MTTAILLVALAACLCVAGFCAGAETGFLALSRVRLLSLCRNGSARARQLADVIADMGRVLNTLLVGNNLAAVLVSTISAALAIRMFAGRPWAQTAWSAAVASAMIFLGEYLPKLLYSSRPLRRTMASMQAYHSLAAVLFPFVAAISALVRAAFPSRNLRTGRLAISRDGIRTLVQDRNGSTRLTSFERRLIERVLMLQASFASDLMKSFDEAAKADPDFDPIAPGALRIPARTRGDDILPIMRRKHEATAIVVDESTSRPIGVVTEEDVLLALTGVLKDSK